MKFFAILMLISVVLGYSAALECNPSNVGTIIEKCFIQHEGTELDILDAWAGRKARSDNAKCFRACVMMECGHIDSYGHLSFRLPKKLGQILGAGNDYRAFAVESVASYCVVKSHPNGDVCDSAETFIRCVIDNCEHCQLVFPNLKI